ncbi:peptide MFS transporter [Arthrobacter echini]|uniref:Peptide MFS transporter n=1 Tax=Arthrobacter echini TaxID=1529066 RepID=A0A4S5E197_9MICC|nr:peptide MFS transporter [Arthrobacter echini]THJ65121.1 peptide MFS transporter [Arthrobacter echini]
MSTSQQTAAPGGRTFLGHPRMLANLFSVELWERFSFYGMQALLLYYMTYSLADGGLAFAPGTAAGLVGAYGGGVYLSTILGAWVADRILGSERVLFFSAVIIMCGHIALALLPGVVGLSIGLILVGVGSGGLKANASSLVGTLYEPGDTRRDAGFSIFYMGINIGALVGPLLTNLAWDAYGFHVGFGLAAIGMAAGLIQYSVGRRRLPAAAHEVEDPLPRASYPRWIGIAVGVLVLLGVAVATGLLNADNLASIMAYTAIAATIAYFAVILSSRKVSAVERRRVYSFMPLFLASAAFWSLFQQQFTVVALYSQSRLDRTILGWEMPPGMVQSINPIFIIVFAGIFAAVWTRLGKRQPSSPVKFSLGLMVMGLAFLAFIPFAGGGPNSTPLIALAGILLLFTWAELFISPIGLSVTTKLAPEAFRTQMLALFFLSISLGTTVSGLLAGFYSAETEVPYFAFSGIAAIVLGGALLAGAPAIRKSMSGVG